jgi:hypothetical protein
MQDVQDITLGVKREAEKIDASIAPLKRLKRNLTQEQDSKVCVCSTVRCSNLCASYQLVHCNLF